MRYEGQLPRQIIRREYILAAWKNYDPDVLDIEIYESLIRNQIDIEFFVYTCLNHVSDDWLIRLSDPYFKEKYEKKMVKPMQFTNLDVQSNQNLLKLFLNSRES